MLSKHVLGLISLTILVAPAPAAAQTKALGWTSVVAGGALVAAAFDYSRDCGGYRSRYEGGFREGFYVSDLCTTVEGHTTITKNTPWDITLTRTPLLYTGVAAITSGILMATVWADIPMTVAPTLGGVQVGVSFGF